MFNSVYTNVHKKNIIIILIITIIKALLTARVWDENIFWLIILLNEWMLVELFIH